MGGGAFGMTRKSYVQVDGVLYEKGAQPLPELHLVMPDIKPYTSMIDGSQITSRSQHREHLRSNHCTEVGNETKAHFDYYKNLPDVAPQQRKEIIRAQVAQMTNKQFSAAVKRDLDNWKWNSRKD